MNSRLFFRFLRLILALWGVVGVAALAASAFPVTVIHPVHTTWQATVDRLGQVESYGRVAIQAPASGWLRGPRPAQGARVHTGAMLGSIAPPGFGARLRSARAALKLAGIRLRQVQRLYHGRYSAQIALDKARAAYQAAQASVDALEREQASNRLRAPADGNVYFRYPVGAFLSNANATPVIADLEISNPIWIRVGVLPSQSDFLKSGARVLLHRGTWRGTGTLRSVGTSALDAGLVPVLIDAPASSPLRAGEWVHSALPGRRGLGWRLPRPALVMRGAKTLVFVMRRDHARAIEVRLLYAAPEAVWVTGPLHADSKVIVHGAGRVRDGTPVRRILSTDRTGE